MSGMISAVIITYNEADHIHDCIASLDGIPNEVIIVDAQSTDDTVVLAKEAHHNVKTFTKEWEGYGAARNFGAAMAKYDWIFSIDADERCNEELIDAIVHARLEKHNIYHFLRRNVYSGRVMRHGFLSSEWKGRLYHKSQAFWDDRSVHERLKYDWKQVFKKKFEGDLMHYAYADREEHLSRLDQYARLTAISWLHNDRKPGGLVRLLGPYFHFFKAHFLKLGILERAYGIETSKAAYYYSKWKYNYYYELKSSEEETS